MIPQDARRLGYYAGTKWFQWGVLLVVCGLLAAGLINALDDAKARAERQAVELTLRNMRTGMQLAMGEALMQQRQGEIVAWVGSDPVRWLGTTPNDYHGVCQKAAGNELETGAWCFDAEHKELLYRPRSDTLLRQPNGVAAKACHTLRWRVTRTPPQGAYSENGFIGLRIEPVKSCQ